jgi:hypothetical protein
MGETIELKKQEQAFMELGLSGLNRQSGNVYEEFLKELQGTRGVQVFKEMRDNDSTVGAVLFAVEMLMRQVEWRVEAASNEDEDIAAAEFLESCLHDMDMTWEETISEILSMLPFGWAYHEIIYKKREGNQGKTKLNSRYQDGRIGWRKLPLRAQETLYEWKFDDKDGSLLGMYQQPPPDYRIRFIPIEKALLFRTKVRKGNPEGVSILRNAYRDFYFKKHIENIEGIGIERDLAGLPVALVPPEILKANASMEARATLNSIETLIKNIRRDEQEGVIFPKAMDENGRDLYELKLLSTGGTRQFDTDKIIARKDRGIAGSVLADFVLLGHEGVGSFALSSSKTTMFANAIGAWMDLIASVFNNVAIPRLFALNSFNIETLPQLKHGDIETMNLDELGNFVQRLTASGARIFPNAEIENFLLRQAGMPEIDFEAQDQDFLKSVQAQRAIIDSLKSAIKEEKTSIEVASEILSKASGMSVEAANKALL